MGWEHSNMHTLDPREEEEAAHYSTVGYISYCTVCSAETDYTFRLKNLPISPQSQCWNVSYLCLICMEYYCILIIDRLFHMV